MLIETSLLYVVLAVSSAKSGAGEGVVCLSSDKNQMVFSVSKPASEIIPTDLVTAIGRDLSTVAEVRHVMAEHAEGNLLVWILADNPDAEVREKIFNKQFSIIDGFPEISFDFNLISSARSIRETSSSARLIYTREG
jgi:hypothetical protein